MGGVFLGSGDGYSPRPDPNDELAARRYRKQAQAAGFDLQDFLLSVSRALHAGPQVILHPEELARREAIRAEAISVIRVGLPDAYRMRGGAFDYGFAVMFAHRALLNFQRYGRRSHTRRVRDGVPLAPSAERIERWRLWSRIIGKKAIRGTYTLEENYVRRRNQLHLRLNGLWSVLAERRGSPPSPPPTHFRPLLQAVLVALRREPCCWKCGCEPYDCACALRDALWDSILFRRDQAREPGAEG